MMQAAGRTTTGAYEKHMGQYEGLKPWQQTAECRIARFPTFTTCVEWAAGPTKYDHIAQICYCYAFHSKDQRRKFVSLSVF
jgi:hypothetical protein